MSKRLCKSSSNKVIFGVCGGLGEYLNIDPILFRIIWLISVLCYGSGLLLYLIFAICMLTE